MKINDKNLCLLTNKEIVEISGGGLILDVAKKLGEAWGHLRDCFSGCQCSTRCSDPGARDVVRFLS